MAQSSTVGVDRIKELDNLFDMLQADTLEIRSNVEQTIKLKAVLEKALEARYNALRWGMKMMCMVPYWSPLSASL